MSNTTCVGAWSMKALIKVGLIKVFVILALTLWSIFVVLDPKNVAVGATQPEFSPLHISGLSKTTAIVAWTTEVPTNTFVSYSRDGEAFISKGKNESVRYHFVNLSYLTPGAHYEVLAYTTLDNLRYDSPSVSFTTLPNITVVTPPGSGGVNFNILPALEMNNPSHGNITATSAWVYWTTNNPSSSYVQYYTNPGDAEVAGQNDSVSSHAVKLSNLRPNTTYSYRVKSKDRAGHELTSGVFTFRTGANLIIAPFNPPPDTREPLIQSLRSSEVTQTSAKISWDTNEEANSWVFFSTTATDATFVMEYEFSTGTNNFTPAGLHEVSLTGLMPGTTYSYRAISKDRSQNFGVSNRGTFTTLPADSNQINQEVSQDLAGEGDELAQALDAILFRDELLGRNFFEGESSKSAQGSEELAKQALIEELKKESEANGSLSTLPALAGSAAAMAALPLLLPGLFVLMIVLVIGAIVLLKLLSKKHSAKRETEAKIAGGVEISKKANPTVSTKTVVVGAVLLVLLMLTFSMLPFLTGFLFSLPYYFEQSDNDKKVEEVIKEYKLKSVPKAISKLESRGDTAIAYYAVSEEVKNLSLDCSKISQEAPLSKGDKYYCQNIYQAEVAQLKQNVEISGASRILLYGQYVYFDCPASLEGAKDVLDRCLRSAQFVDSWQLPKMFEVFGLSKPLDKAYLYFAKTDKEIDQICESSGVACIKSGNEIYAGTKSGNQVIYSDQRSVEAVFYEGKNQEVSYKTTLTTPESCYMPHLHELIHYVNAQYFGGAAIDWFEEGFNYFITNRLYKEICPPGPVYGETVKIESGSSTKQPSFDPDELDKQEPLSTRLESYSEGLACRRAIFTILAKYIDEEGLKFSPKFYVELKRLSSQRDADFARAVYLAGGSQAETKTQFKQKGCSF